MEFLNFQQDWPSPYNDYFMTFIAVFIGIRRRIDKHLREFNTIIKNTMCQTSVIELCPVSVSPESTVPRRSSNRLPSLN